MKYFVFNREKLLLTCSSCTIILMGIFITLNSMTTIIFSLTPKSSPSSNFNFSHKEVSLLFNIYDAQAPTSDIVSLLDKFNILATFFLDDAYINKNENIVKTINSNSHEIGIIASNYIFTSQIKYDDIYLNIFNTCKELEKTTNKDVMFFSSHYTNKNVEKALTELNMILVEDFIDFSPTLTMQSSKITNFINDNLSRGGIILFDIDKNFNLENLRIILETLNLNNFEITSLRYQVI